MSNKTLDKNKQIPNLTVSTPYQRIYLALASILIWNGAFHTPGYAWDPWDGSFSVNSYITIPPSNSSGSMLYACVRNNDIKWWQGDNDSRSCKALPLAPDKAGVDVRRSNVSAGSETTVALSFVVPSNLRRIILPTDNKVDTLVDMQPSPVCGGNSNTQAIRQFIISKNGWTEAFTFSCGENGGSVQCDRRYPYLFHDNNPQYSNMYAQFSLACSYIP